ncbi:putative transcription factor/ chromatin remodeling BED-type(Zn) family [Helianthus annuus]|nr:putative transcription factor/ chromatin remodeling BED-type(Zn) family [Helianthus annuus]
MEAIPTENNALVNMEMHLEPVYLGMETNNIETTPPTKRRKKKSMVWEHFTIETVSPGCRRACCKQCKQSFAYSMGSKVAGTSHLKRHIAKGGCPVVLRNQQQDPMAMTPFSAPSKIANDSAGPTPTTDPPKLSRKRRLRTNTFFHEVWKIQLELTRAATSEDPVINTIAKPMQVGFDTYWKSCCLILAIAVVMDPRFKMKLVEFSFTKIYGEEAASYINLVDEGIHQMFLEYVGGLEGSVKQEDVAGLGLTDFDMYIMETTSQQSKSELDQYLEESLLPRVHEFDVMGWWKLNKVKYPTLSKMARDILTVPVSTVAPELVFETERKEMDRYRCSLRPETVEAVICAKDWLVGGGGNGDSVDMMKAMVKMEFPI